MKYILPLSLIFLGLSTSFHTPKNKFATPDIHLENGFLHPPDSAKPFVYWYWINQNISKEGITADLEAMKRVGIGGALLIQAGLPPEGKVPFLSEEFVGAIGHALKEASRLGLRISINNGDGWSGSGGPWIKPEHSMKEITWSLTRHTSSNLKSISLPTPFHRHNFYRDIAIIAFPMAEQEWKDFQNKPSITCNAGKLNNALVTDDDPYTADTIQPKSDQALIFDFSFQQPFTAHSFTAGFSTLLYRALPSTGMLQVSDNGKDFKDHQEIVLGWRTNLPTTTVSFPAVTSKYFRLYIPAYHASSPLWVSDLSLHASQRINYWQAKAGYAIKAEQHEERPFLYAKNDSFPSHSGSFVSLDSVIVLTDKVDAQGKLNWKAPKGKWNLLRVGYTTTGQNNAPSTKAGEGLECDKLDPVGIETHFPQVLGKFLKKYAAFHPNTFFGTHTDSWEYNNQNWTEILREEFQKRRKYDLLPYIAALTGGYQIGNKEITERFLYDFRSTLSELITENYFTRFRELCTKHGLVLSGEASGGDQFLYQPFSYQAALPIPMGEFWVNAPYIYPECKSAASVAHIYNKPLAAAESFTSSTPASKWMNYPFSLKSLGDQAFCTGINWLWLHTFVHQPRPDMKPGISLSGWGTHFEHTNTWFEQSKPWMEYLARCQFMLQQGKFSADILYLLHEDIPSTVKTREQVGIPSGYDYDVCDRNVVLNHLEVKDGKFVTSGGMQYSLLILPEENKMSPELLQKIAELVEKGGNVLGTPVLSSNTLTNYPHADTEIKKLIGNLWASTAGKIPTVSSFGKGKMYAGKPVEEVLASHGIKPDFTYSSADKVTLHFIHRKQGNTDFYFVANKDDKEVKAQCTFRIKDKKPEIWSAARGKIQKNIIFNTTPEGITIPLHFDPAGSYFIVFREEIPSRFITSVASASVNLFNNEVGILDMEKGKLGIEAKGDKSVVIHFSDGSVKPVKMPAMVSEKKITSKWNLTFPANLGAPAHATLDSLYSLHLHSEEGIKYFSGTVTYATSFDLDKNEANLTNKRLYLDAGTIAVTASIKGKRKRSSNCMEKALCS
jgi:hypothetical protein